MTYQNFEWTAFREEDLLNAGDHNLGYGDKFTMPGSATVCLSTWDNDHGLSGDNYCNENANDHYGQWAYVDGTAVGGQFYAESYHVLHGSDGKTYYLIEIEVENHNAAGTGDDYFTFYGDVPPAGVELTVGGCGNITGDWLSYSCLDAGPKIEPDPWVFDPDTCTYTIEAEHLTLHGFHVVEGAHASGGELVKINNCQGKLETEFGGETGIYDLTICVQDECDGQSTLWVYVDGEFLQTITLDADTDGYGSNDGGFSAVTLQGLEIPAGATVEIYAQRDGNEFIRIDALKFEEVKFEVCDDPDAVKIDFEGFAAGDVLGSQIDGVTITATGGSGDAMIFDSQNPTGGDGDLETQVAQQGNILIISEDGDSSDPDDAVGGTLTFDFDQPSMVFDIKVIDTEEGGTITLTLADGSTQTFDIPKLVNGGIGQVVMDAQDVVQMEVALNGSGAIDDLCFVPGEEPLGSLSGRYFIDANYDDVDNGEPGVEGVIVYLLDENGNRTGAQTTTDANGNYSFGDLVPGTYGVEFADENGVTLGLSLVAPNDPDGNGDDTNDSDAIGTNLSSVISNITVVAGQDTPDNDAGVEELGSLSGRYFIDANYDDVDNGEPGVEGVIVYLLDENGNRTGAQTTTDANGNYSFGDLVPGTYGVEFADENGVTLGLSLVAANDPDGNGDDTNDSDAIGTNLSSVISNITVVAGQDTPDNDAGVEELGSLSGRYFCDEDGDGLDNDGPDTGILGVTVTLLDADGNPVLDMFGRPVTTSTDANGNYSFTGLVPGTYGVLFTDTVSGKDLTTQNADNDVSDAIDSDAFDLGGGQSIIGAITVVAGQDTPDNDAGVVPNTPPIAGDDSGKGCADEFIFIDLLANDSDPDGDAISVTSISDADETAGVGESITLEDGAVVTLNADGTVTVDGVAAYADLAIGEEATDSFSYTLEDAEGATATANVDVTFCGALTTVDTIAANFPITGNFGVGGFFIGDAYTGLTLNTGDDRFDGILIEAAYCIERGDDIVFNNVDFSVTIYAAVEGTVADAGNGLDNSNIDGNLDLINWIINQDFTSQSNGDTTGDGAGLNYTDTEIQAAIWGITDGSVSIEDPGLVSGLWNGSVANAQEILALALANGEGYVPGEDDLMTFIVIPDEDQTAQGYNEGNDLDQSFIIALPFDQFLEECIC